MTAWIEVPDPWAMRRLRDPFRIPGLARSLGVIETIGRYNPQTEPSEIVIDEERARHWLDHGAQPTNTVRKLLRTKGIAA